MNVKVILIAAVVAILGVGVASYFMNTNQEIPNLADVNETVQESAEELNLDVAKTSEGNIVAGDEDAVEEAVKNVPSQEGEMIVEPGNPVVANVDGKDITRVDVYRFIQTMPQNMQQMPATTVYPVAMDQVINTRIVQNKANESGIVNSDAFKTELEMAKQQIARNVYLQQEVDKKITDKKVQDAYNDFVKGQDDVQERRARHILLETESKANAVIEKLNAGGDFAAVAAELSTGPTASRGGDLGYFSKKEMVPEFSKAAFSMNKGDVSKTPVQTQFGWHVIKIEDIRTRPKPTMAQMEPAIRAELRREVLDELIQKWRKDSDITQFDINGKPLKDGANATGLMMPDAPAE